MKLFFSQKNKKKTRFAFGAFAACLLFLASTQPAHAFWKDLENILKTMGQFFLDPSVAVSKYIDYSVYVNSAGIPVSVTIECDGSYKKVFNNSADMRTGQCRLSTDMQNMTRAFRININTSAYTSVGESIVINPMIGRVVGGSMDQISKTTSRTINGLNVSYGFYDGPPGAASRAYVYVTPSQADWMKKFVENNPAMNNLPLSKFVFPGAHDAGMDRITTPSFNNLFYQNIALTQKEDATALLNLGARYFDFRAGYSVSNATAVAAAFVADSSKAESTARINKYWPISQQHSFIAGRGYFSFAKDVVKFLDAHPKEIVILDLNVEGFISSKMEVDEKILENILSEVIRDANSDIKIVSRGAAPDTLKKTYAEVIKDNERIILLNRAYTTRLDSFNLNNSEAENVMPNLRKTQADCKTIGDITFFQLQSVASMSTAGLASNLFAQITRSAASSELMGTKIKLDAQTYPWVANDAWQCKGPVIVMNDFYDNALTDFAIRATKKRMQ